MTIVGKPAGSILCTCPLCKGTLLFTLIGQAPAGTKIGEVLPVGNYTFTILECTTCGENYTFGQPVTLIKESR